MRAKEPRDLTQHRAEAVQVVLAVFREVPALRCAAKGDVAVRHDARLHFLFVPLAPPVRPVAESRTSPHAASWSARASVATIVWQNRHRPFVAAQTRSWASMSKAATHESQWAHTAPLGHARTCAGHAEAPEILVPHMNGQVGVRHVSACL